VTIKEDTHDGFEFSEWHKPGPRFDQLLEQKTREAINSLIVHIKQDLWRQRIKRFFTRRDFFRIGR